MTIESIALVWTDIEEWHKVNLLFLRRTRGLLRVQRNNKTLFIGFAAAKRSGLGPRLAAYRNANGTGQKHHAGRLIYDHRASIKMQIAVLDIPGWEIKQLAQKLIYKESPKWNVRAEQKPW